MKMYPFEYEFRWSARVGFAPLFCVLGLLFCLARPALAEDASAQRSEQAELVLKRLIDDLDSDDLEVRLSAIKFLGQYREERAVEGLLRHLTEDEPDLQVAAAEALGKISSPKFIEFLYQSKLEFSPRLRQAVALALENYPVDTAIPLLIELLDDPAEGVREAAIKIMKSRTALTFGLRAGDSPIARARALERWRTWWQQAEGLEAGQRWVPALPLLDASGKLRVIGHIKKNKSLAAVPLLVGLLEDGSKVVRQQADRVLQSLVWRDFGFKDTYPPGTSTYDNIPLAQWRLWLKRTKYEEPEAICLSALDDAKAKYRIQGINGLGGTGKMKYASVLVEMLDDDCEPVRRAAHQALFQLTGRKLDYNSRVEGEPRNAMITRWRQWLSDSVDKGRLEIIIDALGARDAQVCARALVDLNNLNPRVAVDHAIKRLLDPAYAVRKQAVNVLKQHFDLDFGYSPELPGGAAGARRAKLKWEQWWRFNRQRHKFKGT
ncbi:HEAT repeat domain-containing protein [Planctomycetota bacterium]